MQWQTRYILGWNSQNVIKTNCCWWAGATRNFEQWKADQTIEEVIKSKREAEDEDRVKKLENKTTDSKREMDIMDALDDMLHIKGQQQHITPEQVRAILGNSDPSSDCVVAPSDL